jgi:hypothetical protein
MFGADEGALSVGGFDGGDDDQAVYAADKGRAGQVCEGVAEV